MKILYIGCVEASEILLSSLLEHGFDICGVVTKKESKANSDFADLSVICESHAIPFVFYQPSRYEAFVDFVRLCKPDIVYCFGWSHLLKEDVLDIPSLGTVGFHPAELPKNRGRHPLIWALVLGLKQTASTFFMIQPGVDNGNIVSQVHIDISADETARSLYDKVLSTAKVQLIELTKQFRNGTVNYVMQDESLANTWRKRGEKDGLIDFRMKAETISRLVKALGRPYVGAHFMHNGSAYKVWEAEAVAEADAYANLEYGKVLEVYGSHSFLVKADDGLLKVLYCDMITLRIGDYL